MAPEAWGWLLICALGAEIVGTMAGFGAATILTPLAALFLDMKTAIAMVACFHLFGNIARLWFFRGKVDWKIWCQFGITGICLSLVGARITMGLDARSVGQLFGVFLVCYVGTSLLLPERIQLPRRPLTLVGGGAVSGFIAGLLGTGGAARSVCLLAFQLPQEVYIATSAAIALVVDATRIPIYIAGQLIPATLVPVLASLILVAWMGSWIGQRLARRLSAVWFRRFVLVMLAVMGIKLLWRV